MGAVKRPKKDLLRRAGALDAKPVLDARQRRADAGMPPQRIVTGAGRGGETLVQNSAR